MVKNATSSGRCNVVSNVATGRRWHAPRRSASAASKPPITGAGILSCASPGIGRCKKYPRNNRQAHTRQCFHQSEGHGWIATVYMESHSRITQAGWNVHADQRVP